MLENAKKNIIALKDKNIKIVVNNIRNKSETLIGYIDEVYDRIFIFNSNDGIKRSFTYSDLISNIIEIIC